MVVTKGQIITMDDCIDKMKYNLRNGKEKGTTTYIPEIDKCWKWRKTELNFWTGYNNEGKSTFVRYLSAIKALEEDWKFLCACPEDYPAEEFFDDIIHTISGQSTDKDHSNRISEALYDRIYERIRTNFIFYYLEPPENTVKAVLKEWEELIDLYNIDAGLIDPLIKFERPAGMEKDDQYAVYISTLMTDFSRRKKLSLHLVLHQVTPPRNPNQVYPKPSAYSIKGGGSFADGVDNVLVVWKPNHAIDKTSTEVVFASEKIKKQKLVGLPQALDMRFDRKTNRFVDFHTGKDLYDFDKHFK